MNFSKRAVLVLLLAGFTIVHPVFANELYVGASVGSSSLDLPSTSPVDDRATAWKAFGGYAFTDALAVEVGYNDFGKFDGTETFNGIVDTFALDISGIDLFVVGRTALGAVDAFAKIGIVDWELEGTGSTNDPSLPGPPVTFRDSIDGNDLAAGLGLDYELGNNFSVRGEVEWFDIDDIDGVFMFSIGAAYRF